MSDSMRGDMIFDFRSGLFYTSFMKRYMLFDHTADIGMEICGRTKKELFINAAWALTDVMIDRREGKDVKGLTRKITVEGKDAADLLVNFLRELLYLFNGEKGVIQNCEIVSFGRRKLTVALLMEPYHKTKHTIKMELKAVTYHGLSVVKEKSGWKARVIFDV